MSSRSDSKVTITLGRKGQVVKTAAGGKRPARERLGANFIDDPSFSGAHTTTNKRQRIGSNGSGLGDGILGRPIEGGDLRLKLIQKGVSKKPPTFNGNVDLREKLLRKLPNKRASDYPSSHTMERGRERQREHDRDRERERGIEKQREREIDPSARRVSATRPVDNLSPYPSWAYDRRDELHPNHRGSGGLTEPLPPPVNRSYLELGTVSTAAAVGTRPCSSGYGLKRGRDMVGGSRVASEYATNGVSMETRKSILPSPPPQKQPDLPETVDELLSYLDLEKYKILFRVEEVDMGTLKQMADSDLKELGIPMGPRKKILLAVRSSHKQRPR